MGVSSKFIIIISNVYKKATVLIKVQQHKNQGCPTGRKPEPNVILHVAERLEQFLTSRGCRGISIDSRSKIILLAYADNIVLFADTLAELR